MIKDYPFASNGKSCMISISAEERPSLKLTIEASSPMDILDIYQDEYGVFFAKYFNSSVEKIEIEGIDAREILYDLKDLRQSAEAERKAKESLHREAIIQEKNHWISYSGLKETERLYCPRSQRQCFVFAQLRRPASKIRIHCQRRI